MATLKCPKCGRILVEWSRLQRRAAEHGYLPYVQQHRSSVSRARSTLEVGTRTGARVASGREGSELGVAVVTGGSRGLGAALCAEYRARGWSVIEFSRTGTETFSAHLDLSDPLEAAEVFSEAFVSLAELEIPEIVVISNAGMVEPIGPVENTTPKAIASHIDVNVTSAILVARAFVSVFQGHDCPKTFVNISSGAAAQGYAGWSLYCASKAALENFVQSMALEQSARDHPIRAISVNPGVMDTAMQATVRASSVFPAVERYVRLKADGMLQAPSAVASRIADLVASRPQAGRVYSASG